MFDLWIEKSHKDGSIICLSGNAPPLAFTDREGGNWLAVGPKARVKEPVAAALFEDGWVFDFILNALGHYPWRRWESRPRVRAKAINV